jgi:hypothetical protein
MLEAKSHEINTMNPRYNGPEYDGKNSAVYDCEFLRVVEALRRFGSCKTV